MRAPKRVLLVDGDPDSRKRISGILGPPGFRCSEVDNAREALAEAKRERPDVILLDSYLPDLSGLGLLDLTPTEFHLLALLVAEAGRVVRRRTLIEQIWGEKAPHTDRAVDAHIKAIRRKLGKARDRLETVRGVGYRFSDPVVE